MSEFPLNIPDKEDYPDKINKLTSIDIKYYETADETNRKRKAIEENRSDIDSNAIKSEANSIDIIALIAGQTGGLLSFTTLALLQAYATPNINDSYKVTNDDVSSNNGYYHWTTGTTYVKDAELANGVVADGNVDAVNGGTAFNEFQKTVISTPKLIQDILNSYTVNHQGYVNTSGVVVGEGTDANFSHTTLTRIKPSSTLTYSGTSTPVNVNQVSFYDINEVYISGVVGGADSSVVPPINAVFTRVCYETASIETALISAYILENTADEVVINRTNIETINSDAIGAYKLNDDAFGSLPLTFGYVNTSGVIVGEGVDTNWYHTQKQAIKPSSVVTYSGTETPTNVNQVSFYDINEAYISGVGGDTDGDTVSPVNAVFVRFCKAAVAVLPVVSFISIISTFESINYKVNISDVVDNLTSKEVSAPLSANQGKTLNDKIINLASNLNTLPAKNYNYDVNHIIHYGQSLSQGDWEDEIISDVQPYNTLMFNGGIRTWEYVPLVDARNSLAPAIERLITGSTVGATTKGETPASGSADLLVDLIQSEDGFAYTDQQYQVLISAPGMGGTGIVSLSDKAGIYYQRLILDVTKGKELANASNKTYWCPVVTWVQGEYDTYYDMSQVDYYNKMVSLFTDLNTDIKAITGQSEDVQFLLYQTQAFDWYFGGKFTYPDVSLAQLQITQDVENVHMATPIYHLPTIPNDVHFTAIGSKWFGGYFGVAYKRLVIDKKPYSAIKLLSSTVIGNDIYLKFEAPVFPLRFDTTNVVDRGVSKGFQIREVADRAQNSFLNIITNVEINKYDTIKVSCSSSPVGKKLTYAINGTSVTDTSSGNLRDSQAIKFDFKNISTDVSKSPHDMYNWCPLFETILT